jgi:siroheme synthase
MIPGVTSVTAAGATGEVAPCTKRRSRFSIIPSDLGPLSSRKLPKRRKTNGLHEMCLPEIQRTFPKLGKSGLHGRGNIALIKRCTLPEENFLIGKLSDVNGLESKRTTSPWRL